MSVNGWEITLKRDGTYINGQIQRFTDVPVSKMVCDGCSDRCRVICQVVSKHWKTVPEWCAMILEHIMESQENS